MMLSGLKVVGPEKPRVGDFVVMFFNLKYVGEREPVTFERLYVSAELLGGFKEGVRG